ncbi:penicillin-binding transpeptidase domain-containing protein [Streptomyces sp. BI20]|uniref:penicillin-binding transpeptidase domain-containing protein n=1 Tax=Streptomyces sp. BI20 TaxID=3403460 RepID=UPI003C744FDF
MNGAAKGVIVGGVFLAMVGGAGYGVWTLVGDDGGSGSSSSGRRTGPVTADEVADTSKRFLEAWASGESETAAALTTDQAAASPVLLSFVEGAKIPKATITPRPAVGSTVAFTVSAEVGEAGATKKLSYESKLTVVRGQTTGRAVVSWAPSVVHPQLAVGETLKTGAPTVPPVVAVDRSGVELDTEKHPGLKGVVDVLRGRYGAKAGGESGVELWIEPATPEGPRRTLLTLEEGTPGRLKTRLDAEVQSAAEKAVAQFPESSVVALDVNTGDVLAVANNRKDGFNAAMQGGRAPGSTMKIVTAAMLMDRGVVAADKPAPCPQEVSWEGTTFHNLNRFSLPEGTPFSTSFARSCNTAFIKGIKPVADPGALGKEAREVFGIGLDWKVGVDTKDGTVPDESGSGTAAAYIGQGKVQMNPLNVASITATARSGVFNQPLLVSADLLEGDRAQAARTMKPEVRQQLVAMMRQTAESGTGRAAMASVSGDKGAKTGSAEVGGPESTPDSWFTGFAGGMAVAAMVENGGHGGDAAGPIVAKILNSR